MDDAERTKRRNVGRVLLIAVVMCAIVALVLAVYKTNENPRTDDANVWANYIEIAPEVTGKVVQLPVKDNQFVKKGDLLYEIDPRPYEYALQQALADQELLEQQIIDYKRRISAQNKAVAAANAAAHVSRTGIQTAGSSVDLARASVARAQASVVAAEAKLKYATNDRDRIQPLLAQQYVTVEQVDQANTAVSVAQGSYDEAQAALVQAQAAMRQAVFQHEQARNNALESLAKLGQTEYTVDRIETLLAQRPLKAAKVDDARLNLKWARVLAPFDAYVTAMNISEGAYAHAGTPLFTLIDTRNWYVIANYRESKLKKINIGDPVDVYLLGHPDQRFHGNVESIGYGVLPEDARVSAGLPQIERTLNWVHLSSRFPVRIRVSDPDPRLFRVGATAVTVVR